MGCSRSNHRRPPRPSKLNKLRIPGNISSRGRHSEASHAGGECNASFSVNAPLNRRAPGARRAHLVALAVLALILGPRLAGAADPPGRYQGMFGSANYLISVPPDWNGGLRHVRAWLRGRTDVARRRLERNRKFVDSPLERAGFEPSVPGESGFDFAREVRGRLFAGGSWIRTFGSARDRLRFKALLLVGRLVVRRIEGADE
jgi:hypothetical protein